MQAVPELEGIISPVYLARGEEHLRRLSKTVTSCSWRQDLPTAKHVPAFVKRLSFPGRDDTSRDEEWDSWRKRNLGILRARIWSARRVDPKYVLPPYTYRLEDEPCVLVPRTSLGNISQYVKHHEGLTERNKLSLLIDAAYAIAHLHRQKPPIVHGSIHPFEIMITEERRAVLFDFGLDNAVATLEPPPAQATIRPTAPMAGYCAPERRVYSEKSPFVDVYAFGGVILAVMSGLHPPTRGRARPETHENLSKDHPLWPFLNTIWVDNEAERPTMPDVAQFLEDLMKTQPPNMVGKEPGHAVQPQDPPAPLQPDLELLGTESKAISSVSRLRIDLQSLEFLAGKLGIQRATAQVEHKDLAGAQVRVQIAGKRPKSRLQDFGSHARAQTMMARELRFLSGLSHPDFTKLAGFVESPSPCAASLDFPWMKDENVREFLLAGPWKIPEQISLLYDVASGLEYLQSQSPSIYHWNLEFLNIIIRKNHRAVITDGGSAGRKGSTSKLKSSPSTDTEASNIGPSIILQTGLTQRTWTGPSKTPSWPTLESVDGELPPLTSDIRSFDWILWKIMTGRLPFKDLTENADLLKAISQYSPPSAPRSVSLSTIMSLWNLMADYWGMYSEERPSAAIYGRTPFPISQFISISECFQDGTQLGSAHHLRVIGEMHLREFRISEGLQNIKASLEISRENQDSVEIASTLLSLGRALCLQCEYQKAGEAYTEAKELHTRLRWRQGLAQALCGLGHVYSIQGDFNTAQVCLAEAHEINAGIGSEIGAAEALYGLAELYRRRGYLSKAKASYIRARRIYVRLDNTLGVAETGRGLGDIQRMQCLFDLAEPAYLRAVALYEQLANPLGISKTKCGLAAISLRRSMHAKAEELYHEARHLAEQIGHPVGLANALCGLGHAHRLENRYAEAASCFHGSRDKHTLIGNRIGVAEAICGLGDTYRMQAKYSETEAAYVKARDVYNQVGHYLGVADTVCGLGHVDLAQGRDSEAESLFNEAESLYMTEEHDIGVANAAFGLAAVHLVRSEHSSASSRLRSALDSYTKAAIPSLRASALLMLALTLEIQQKNDEAIHSIEEAIAIYTKIGDGRGVSACRQLRRRVRDVAAMDALVEIVTLD